MEETIAGHFIQNRFHHPVTFLFTAGAQSIRLPPRHTAPPGVVCAGRHFHFSNLATYLLNDFFLGTSFGLCA